MRRRQLNIQPVTALVMLILAGCATRTPEVESMPPPPITEPATISKPSKPPKPVPKPAPPSETASPEITLTGLARPEVTSVLGEPQEQRDSNPGRIWVYRSGSCVIEILFLLDMMRNDDFVVDHRVSGTDGTPKAEQACLRRIIKNQNHGK